MTTLHPAPLDASALGETLGLYSHAFVAPPGARILAIAGQLAVRPDGSFVGPSFEDQFEAVMENMGAVLTAAGTDFRSIMKFTTYLVDAGSIEAFYAVREQLWPRYFAAGAYPANTLLVVQRLVRPEFKIEIEAIAAIA